MTKDEFIKKHCCHDSHAEFCDEKCDKCEKEFREDLEEHDTKIKVEVIEKIKELIKEKLVDNLMLEDATKYGNKNAKQQANSYATIMKYEIADCVDDLLDDLEQLKEQDNE